MRKGKNLFVEADLGEVASEISEVTSEVKTTKIKGVKMNRKDVVIADNPKDVADTLYKLNRRVDAKVKFFNTMLNEMRSEVFKLKAEARAGVNLSVEMTTIPTMRWNAKAKTEALVDVVVPKIERLVSLENKVSSLEAEVRRLGYAKTQIMQKAVMPGVTGHEKFYLRMAVVKNDATKSSYPSQEFKAIDNSLGLMRSVGFEIRNVILERLDADIYTKKNAGYFQGDARRLKEAAAAKRRMLSRRDWKLGYDLEEVTQ